MCKPSSESIFGAIDAPHRGLEVVHSDTRAIPSYPQRGINLGITLGVARREHLLGALFDARGELGHLVVDRAALGDELRDLLVRVHHGRVVTATKQLTDLG